jgi:hypothetical protein
VRNRSGQWQEVEQFSCRPIIIRRQKISKPFCAKNKLCPRGSAKTISHGGNPFWPPMHRRKSNEELNFWDPVCFWWGERPRKPGCP